MINANALRHPRTQWEIESAMWRAVDYGAAIATSAKGGEIVSIIYDAKAIPAFEFWKDSQNVTADFLKVLRDSV